MNLSKKFWGYNQDMNDLSYVCRLQMNPSIVSTLNEIF